MYYYPRFDIKTVVTIHTLHDITQQNTNYDYFIELGTYLGTIFVFIFYIRTYVIVSNHALHAYKQRVCVTRRLMA